MILHWHFDPVLFSLGPLTVRWYGLLFVGGFYLGLMMLQRIFRSEGRDPAQAERLFMYALLGTVIGARLAHCLFYEPAYYLAHPLAILRIWEGGLASHGGVAGLLIGLWLGTRGLVPRPAFLWLVDRVAIPGAFVAVCIRIANFLNSEIVGLPTSGRWGVVFEAVDAQPRHPAQLYEAAAYLLVFGLLAWLYRRFGARSPHGLLSGVQLAHERGPEDVIDERRLAGARDAGHGAQDPEREADVDVAQVVLAGAEDLEPAGGLAPGLWDLDAVDARQEAARRRLRVLHELVRGALGDDVSAELPGAGSEVEHVVGGLDGLLVVLDDQDGVAQVAQTLQRAHEAQVIALVQADRRLVEHVHDARQLAAELRREPDPLGLAAR